MYRVQSWLHLKRFFQQQKKPNTTTDFRNLSVWLSKMFRLWPNRAVENETRRGAHAHTASMYWAGCWCRCWTLISISFSPLPFYLSDAICILHHHRSYCSSHFWITRFFFYLYLIFPISSIFLVYFLECWRMDVARVWVCVCLCACVRVLKETRMPNTITNRSSSRISRNETIIHFIIPAGTFVSSVIGFRHRFHRSIVVSAIYYLFVIVWLLP